MARRAMTAISQMCLQTFEGDSSYRKPSVPINFAVTQTRLHITDDGNPTGTYVDLDSVRLRKALAYLIRAMARRCKQPGVHVSIESHQEVSEQLHVSVHSRGFAPLSDGESVVVDDAATMPRRRHYSWVGASVVTRIALYLFRTLGITPLFGTSNDGSVSVLLDATCTYSVETQRTLEPRRWRRRTRCQLLLCRRSVAEVDSRADLLDYEVTLISFARTVDDLSNLRSKSALLIDVSDIAAALLLQHWAPMADCLGSLLFARQVR